MKKALPSPSNQVHTPQPSKYKANLASSDLNNPFVRP